jgi:hypothetical protein
LAPNDVTNKNINKIRVITINKGEPAMEETKSFKLGDQVRVLKKKGVFSKGSDMFSQQINTIDEINKLLFKLKNKSEQILKQRFKNWQLKKVNEVEEAPKIEIPVEEQHSSKEIRKDNKMKRLQNKEFGEGKGHEVQEISDNNEVVYKSRLRAKNEIREKPKMGFEIGDKVKSEFIKLGSKKWYNGNVVKVNPATYPSPCDVVRICAISVGWMCRSDKATPGTSSENAAVIASQCLRPPHQGHNVRTVASPKNDRSFY